MASHAQPHKPAQSQPVQPGHEHQMHPSPRYQPLFPGVGRLSGKVALISGGDSGIGRAAAAAFANEGADIAIAYLSETEDAEETKAYIEKCGRRAHLVAGDLGYEENALRAVQQTLSTFGKLDILVNNCGEQHVVENFEEISADQIERTFRSNVFSYLYLAKAALPVMKEGGTIINTASVTAFKGNPVLVDYSATRGAVVSLTRALARQLAKRGIRVNAVAPGPIWTPLIPSSFAPEHVEGFGEETELGRPGEPNEVGAALLFLASPESCYITGEVINVNGGTPV